MVEKTKVKITSDWEESGHYGKMINTHSKYKAGDIGYIDGYATFHINGVLIFAAHVVVGKAVVIVGLDALEVIEGDKNV